MPDEPFRLGCGRCGDNFDTPEQYIDHVLATEHAPAELLAQLRDGSGYASLVKELTTIQEFAARGDMPPNIRAVGRDHVPDHVIEQFAALERREMEEYAATLTTRDLIAHLEVLRGIMEKFAAVRSPGPAGENIIRTVRAAEIRLRELAKIELAKVSEIATAELIAKLRQELSEAQQEVEALRALKADLYTLNGRLRNDLRSVETDLQAYAAAFGRKDGESVADHILAIKEIADRDA